jgi:hypothetical protein
VVGRLGRGSYNASIPSTYNTLEEPTLHTEHTDARQTKRKEKRRTRK